MKTKKINYWWLWKVDGHEIRIGTKEKKLTSAKIELAKAIIATSPSTKKGWLTSLREFGKCHQIILVLINRI